MNRIGPGFSSSASHPDEIKSRNDRLMRALAMASDRIAEAFRRKVANLDDHKGELTVTWRSEPTEEEKQAFFSAWEAEEEPGDNVYHEVSR